MKTAIVILNYNGKAFLERFLPSVLAHSGLAEIIVADNASQDDSVAFLQKNYPQLRLISLPKNHGFAKGYNLALKELSHQYFILLNSDVEVSPNWASILENFMDKNPHLAACQPKIKSFERRQYFEHAGAAGGFLDKWGFPFCRGRIFDTTEQDTGQYDNAEKEVFWASGAAFVVRREAFWQAGGFDEDFFAHMEEIDLCWRLQHLGHEIGVCMTTEVFHVGGGTLQMGSPFKTYLNFRNNLFMLFKNYSHGGMRLFVFIFLRLCWDGLAGTKFFLEGKMAHTWAIIRAHWAFYGALPRLFGQRKAISPQKFPKGFWQKSIVWAYFIEKKRSFTEIFSKN